MFDKKLKRILAYFLPSALLIAIIFFFLFRTPTPDHYDFLKEFFSAEKTGFDENDRPERYMPDSNYVFDHSFIRKEFAKIFSINTVSIAVRGQIKARIEDEVEDGAYRLIFPYRSGDLWGFSFDLKKNMNGDKWRVAVATLDEFCRIQISKFQKGKNIEIDSFNYRLENKQDNILVIGFFGDFLVIFSKKEILYQQKDKDLFCSGFTGFSLEKAAVNDKRFSLKYVSIDKSAKEELLNNINARHKDLRDHRLNVRSSIWNEMLSRQSLILGGKKSPFLQRVKLGEQTMPAMLIKMNSIIKYRLKIPERAKMDFAFSVVPEYVSDIRRLRFNVEVQNADGKIEMKKEIDPSSFADPFKSFNPVSIDLSKYSGEKIICFYPCTRDGKIVEHESNILVSIASPSIYLKSEDPRPNVILISLDALKQDHLGCYGYVRGTSPNLDSLAADSAVFLNAITAANWTIPSHMTILTGLYPLEAGFVPGGLLNAKSYLADNVTTLASYLRKHGYYTLGVHGGGYVSEFYGFDKGFSDYIKGSKDAAEGIETIRENLERHKGSKFFIFFHTLEIHWPYVRDSYLKALPPDSSLKEKIIARYDSGIKYTDYHLGEFFKWMKTNGLYDNTIIVIISDHGETFRLINDKSTAGSHGSTLHEDEIKIPFIFHIPGLKSKRIEYQIATVDILPTILDYLDIEPESELRGISLMPIVESDDIPRSRYAYSEATNSKHKFQSIRSNDFKLIASSSSIRAMTSGEHTKYRFIDLKKDPDETQNLFDRERQSSKIYVDFLRKLLASIRSNMINIKHADQDSPTENKELEEQLKGLGYIGN